MKKIFLLALLALVSVSAFARKSYITISRTGRWMTGDVPTGISGLNYNDNDGVSFIIEVGKVLNILTQYGYEVEFMSSSGITNESYNRYINTYFLLSKEVSSNESSYNSDYAKKSYITIDGFSSRITGNVPTGISGLSYTSDYAEFSIPVGEVLNKLTQYGYEVEFMSSSNSGRLYSYFLLSKDISSSQSSYNGDVNKDGKVNVSDIATLVNIILGIVRDNPSLLEQHK
jgi:hypothetical protein